MTHFLLVRGSTYYFNRRIHGSILRLSLHTTIKALAKARAARLYVLTDICLRENMDFNAMRLLARQEAERLHKEWIIDELNEGLSREKLIEMDRNDEIIDSEMIDVATDERRSMSQRLNAWAELEFIDLKKQTLDERNPKFIRSHQIGRSVLSSLAPVTEAVNVSSRLDQFLSYKKASKDSLKDATLNEYRKSVDDFIGIMGDVGVSTISFESAIMFRDSLKKLPTNRTKGKYKGKAVSELLTMEIAPTDCLASKTIKGRLANLTSYFAWLKQCQVVNLNPFEGVTIEADSKSYSPYSSDDLTAIFSSDLFKETNYRKNYGKKSQWWLLVLGVYTGARLGELAQLRLQDITEEDGILSISITDRGEGMGVKTSAGIRKFPVHPDLLELGFTEYLAEVKSGGYPIVLPGLPKKVVKSGDSASKWYNERYRKDYLPESFKVDKKVFHSFRHTFIQTASQCDVDLTKLQFMVGHEPGEFKETSTYLGTPYTQEQLLNELKKLNFKGLDLDFLRGGWQGIPKL